MIEAAFERSVDAGAASPLLPSRLHDFGFRGCCTVEQSVIGGAAHLLNFAGTDTLSAAYYVQVLVCPFACWTSLQSDQQAPGDKCPVITWDADEPHCNVGL